MARSVEPFSAEEVERARRYHRPLYWTLLGSLVLELGLLALLAFARPGDWVYGLVDGPPWWATAWLFPALIVVVLTVVRLPLAYWRGYLYEHRWGFSTQTRRGWLADRLKALAIGVVLSPSVLWLLVASAHWFPDAWPFLAGAGAGLLVLLLTFVAPVVLEPIFNRFRPLEDAALADDLRRLSRKAGVPVRDVLVADASRRTKKQNAYVSGIGATRRVVLFDTLLAEGKPEETRLVVAHELGHRRARHVAKGTALGVAGAAASVAGLWLLTQWEALLDAAGARGAGDPRIVPLVLLAGSLLQLTTAPLGAAVSRRWEREADTASLELTGDADAFEAAHRKLATANLSELAPPRALYLLLFTHPTAPERIAFARRWREGNATRLSAVAAPS